MSSIGGRYLHFSDQHSLIAKGHAVFKSFRITIIDQLAFILILNHQLVALCLFSPNSLNLRSLSGLDLGQSTPYTMGLFAAS